jgi:hypothetical protein
MNCPGTNKVLGFIDAEYGELKWPICTSCRTSRLRLLQPRLAIFNLATMPDAAPKAQRKPFPHSPDEFQHDDRVSFDKRENKWILEDQDGSEWEYSEALGKWMPSVRPLA